MSDTTETPGTMDLFFSRTDGEKNGSIKISINNTGHFIDALNFAKKHGLEKQFFDGFLYLIQSNIGPTLPQRATTMRVGDEDIAIKARSARDGNLEIWPDSHNAPSFMWMLSIDGKHRTTGGLNYHRDARIWSVNT